MKQILVLITATLLSLAVNNTSWAHTEHHQHEAKQHSNAKSHHCPMHPEVEGAKKDSCHKCGMNLEAKAKKVANTHHCPMHPEVKGGKGDSCPKCGMYLEANNGAAKSAHNHH